MARDLCILNVVVEGDSLVVMNNLILELTPRSLMGRNDGELASVDDEVEYDDKIFPPHDLVANGSGVALNPRRE
ncbi:uncharacterized protein G2W53_004508 [Senna tora]|uniref:Uncharacterized protein n=1 Tax=Senna tora TaxID=362788 RepID=A0A834XD23_9FABA|nr:uncharacterized protein G2W53_004508 [Senna tora]